MSNTENVLISNEALGFITVVATLGTYFGLLAQGAETYHAGEMAFIVAAFGLAAGYFNRGIQRRRRDSSE